MWLDHTLRANQKLCSYFGKIMTPLLFDLSLLALHLKWFEEIIELEAVFKFKLAVWYGFLQLNLTHLALWRHFGARQIFWGHSLSPAHKKVGHPSSSVSHRQTPSPLLALRNFWTAPHQSQTVRTWKVTGSLFQRLAGDTMRQPYSGRMLVAAVFL